MTQASPEQHLGVWDIVSHALFGEGQIVSICGPKAEVHFRDQQRVILQSALRFMRHGTPREFLPPQKSSAGGSRRHPPEEGKEELTALIARGRKKVPKLAIAYANLVNDLLSEIGSNWYYYKALHGQVSNRKTGRMRNCFWLGLDIENAGIDIGIPYAAELPKQHHKKFIFKPKGYHGHDEFVRWLETKELPLLSQYRAALLDVIRFARHGHL